MSVKEDVVTEIIVIKGDHFRGPFTLLPQWSTLLYYISVLRLFRWCGFFFVFAENSLVWYSSLFVLGQWKRFNVGWLCNTTEDSISSGTLENTWDLIYFISIHSAKVHSIFCSGEMNHGQREYCLNGDYNRSLTDVPFCIYIQKVSCLFTNIMVSCLISCLGFLIHCVC